LRAGQLLEQHASRRIELASIDSCLRFCCNAQEGDYGCVNKYRYCRVKSVECDFKTAEKRDKLQWARYVRLGKVRYLAAAVVSMWCGVGCGGVPNEVQAICNLNPATATTIKMSDHTV
jgi:hypothetical protein